MPSLQPESIPLPPSRPSSPQLSVLFAYRCGRIAEDIRAYIGLLKSLAIGIDKTSVINLVKKLQEMKDLQDELRAKLKARPSTMTKEERKDGWIQLKHVKEMSKKAWGSMYDGSNLVNALKMREMLGTLVECKECPKSKGLIREPDHGSLGLELLWGGAGPRGERHSELKRNFEQRD